MMPAHRPQLSTFPPLMSLLVQPAFLVRPQPLGLGERRSPMPSLPAAAQRLIVRPLMGHDVDGVGYARTRCWRWAMNVQQRFLFGVFTTAIAVALALC